MRMVEYQHRSEGGGNSVQLPNEVFGHGELIVIVPKTELLALLTRANTLIGDMMPGVKHIALQNYRELNDVCCDLEQTLRQVKAL